MKTNNPLPRSSHTGFTLPEMMISVTIGAIAIGLALSTFLSGARTMYKDSQRLATNASLRTFVAQITNESLDSSYFYVFPYYTALDGSVNLTTDPATLTQDFNDPNDVYDRWVAHGDCLVLITRTSEFRSTDIKKIRIYYRITTSQADQNAEAKLYFYETADTVAGVPESGWGEGTASTSNGHPLSGLATELNAINLSANYTPAGYKVINLRTKGRAVPSPYTGYTAGDRYPIFSTESPTQSSTNGFVSINVEFINGYSSGYGSDNILSSSSFNYTISPRR